MLTNKVERSQRLNLNEIFIVPNWNTRTIHNSRGANDPRASDNVAKCSLKKYLPLLGSHLQVSWVYSIILQLPFAKGPRLAHYLFMKKSHREIVKVVLLFMTFPRGILRCPTNMKNSDILLFSLFPWQLLHFLWYAKLICFQKEKAL